MCVFLFKQAVLSYVVHKSPVYSAFIDSSKAYDRVNHSLFFEKLRSRGTPTCFIRLLKHLYSTQTMRVRWANYVSEAFTVSNGVRQGGVLSPYLIFV